MLLSLVRGACPEAEDLLCGAVARGQRCRPGRWREHCPTQPPTSRERFVLKRIKAKSPGVRVVLGNGGKELSRIGLRGWASIESERQLDAAKLKKRKRAKRAAMVAAEALQEADGKERYPAV